MAVPMYCWHCDAVVPMLDDEERSLMYPLLQAAYLELIDNERLRRESPGSVPRNEDTWSALERYRQLSGRIAADIHEIEKHWLANVGLPCRDCGKPMRGLSSRTCAACGGPRVDDDPRELADPERFAHTIDFEPGVLGAILRRGSDLVLTFPSQPSYSQLTGENPFVIPEFRCDLVLADGHIELRKFRLPMRFEELWIERRGGGRGSFLPVNFSGAGPVSIRLRGPHGAPRLLATGSRIRFEVHEQVGVSHGWTEEEFRGDDSCP